ncbi:unnamed protein product [Protopolystoma xenopodis]|uniref:Uncharacterized protein n=1 Tax=Protopolystoma xenopodis TaxID=117903 RepID=A0A3S5A7J0_9PLAT|nr:unnamed protein product [Protopolystoma xenopodis]
MRFKPMLAYNTTSNSSAIIQPTNPDNPQGALDRSPNTLVDNFLSLCLAEDTDKGHQPPFSRQTLDSSDARGALPSSSPRPVVRMVWPNAIKKPTQGNTSSESMLTISGAHLPVSEPPELSERVNWPHESNCKMCAKFHGEECTQACPVNNGFHIPPTLTITNIPTTSITAASSGLQGRNVVSGVKSMPSFTSPTSRKIKSFRRPMCSANRVSAIGDPGFVEPCVATSDFRSGNLLRIWLERQQQHQQKKNYHHHSHHPLLSPPPPPPSPPQPPRSPHFSPSLFLPTNHNNHSPHRHGQRRTGDSEPSIEWNELPTRVLEQALIPNRSAHMRPELIAHETLVTPAVCGRPPNTHSGHIRGFQFVEFPQVACSPVPPHQPSYHEIPQDANPGHRSHHHHYHDHHLHYWHHRQYHRGKFAGALQSGCV